MVLVDTVTTAGQQYYTADGGLSFGQTIGGLSVARYDPDTQMLEDFEILLRHPAVDGERYEYRSDKLESGVVEVAVSIDSVRTPGGGFEAFTYTVTRPGRGFALEFGFAVDVGMVSLRNAFGTLWLLSSYSVAH